jgi:dephospho-CoA kinase
MLREMGFRVLDADLLAHQLIEPGQPAYEDVLREFGREICDAQGRIERARLGAIVFADPAKLARLNQIVHPRVLEASDQQFAEWAKTEPHGVAFVEAALLVEAGYHQRLDRLVVAWCTPEQQRKRLMERGMSGEEAQRRIGSQMPIEKKKHFATDLIDCSGTLEETRRQVQALAARLRLEARKVS